MPHSTFADVSVRSIRQAIARGKQARAATVEALDPTLPPEYYWRTLSFRVPVIDSDSSQWSREADSIGKLAVVAARYDRALATALVAEAQQQPEDNALGRGSWFLDDEE